MRMMAFTQSLLSEALAPRWVRYAPVTGSTNDDALAWLEEAPPAGALVIADEQNVGRGRLGRPWFAPPGSALLMTIILRPPVEHLTRLTMVGALAVVDVLESYGIADVGIKWPNDVRIGTRKICGVLPEAAWQGDRLQGAVLGIGLNVNIPFIVTPLAETAISILDALGEPVDRLETLQRLLVRLDDWSQQIGTAAIYDSWKARLVTLGTVITVQRAQGTVSGSAEDVTSDGGLILRRGDGVVEHISGGEIIGGGDGNTP